MTGRQLRPGQRTQIWIADLATNSAELSYETDQILLEAPNWTPDGGSLLVNGDGRLWRLDLTGRPELHPVPLDELPPINNDHVLAPDGTSIFLSANDGQLYVAPLAGGRARQVSADPEQGHYLHGVSPDGTTLAYVSLPAGDFAVPGRLALLPVAGGEATFLPAGRGHIDGPEFSPDGAWIYLNTEHFTDRPGHAQLARVPVNGGEPERLVASETVDWFPHLAPDGQHACYLSFPAGTLGHPADLDVEVRVVATSDWTTPVARFPLFGGQGTINVNSWAPDSRRFAYVAYPVKA